MQALAVWILVKFKKIVNSFEICQNCLSYFVHLSDIFVNLVLALGLRCASFLTGSLNELKLTLTS